MLEFVEWLDPKAAVLGYDLSDTERPVDTNSATRLAILRLIDHGRHDLIKQLNAVVFTTVR